MITTAMDVFEDTDQERAIRELPAKAALFLAAINDAAAKYQIPGYTVIVLVPDVMTASVGGYNETACNLLAEANVQVAEKIRQLMVLQMSEHRGKPS